MNPSPLLNENLLQRLPLPLAQLYRRAQNAKTPLERHLAAYFLWEAGLKLLGSLCIIEYVRLARPDPQLQECLQNLARPALGHWWEFVRKLVPVLADAETPGFNPLRDLFLGKAREDLPRCAGLEAALLEALEEKRASRSSVYVAELFDKLVRYRNQEIGHGAVGHRGNDFYERIGQSLLLALTELFAKFDVLAGRQLLFIAEVRQVQGQWLIERSELSGENARRMESLLRPREASSQLPDGQRVYAGWVDSPQLVSLHPLLVYDPEANECAFLNSRRGRSKTEYLCYTTGQTFTRPDWGREQRALLAQALGLGDVSEQQVDAWAAQSQADQPSGEEPLPGRPRKHLGEFELLSELGRGGMGVVYRAWQPSLGRQVALKSMNKPGDPKAEARFRREIKALGQVEHPHVVKIFTSGSEGEQWFYAMELVEGASLGDVGTALQTRAASVTEIDLPRWKETLNSVCEEARKRERPLRSEPNASPASQAPLAPVPMEPAPPLKRPAVRRSDGYVRQIVELLGQTAEAAQALHEHGIIHRDIKPGNILVNTSGDQATLMDLGLAQIADDVEGRLTRTRQFVGTLRYASPEQVLAVGRLDARSDVYSLGATLWELLALKPLFGATEQTPTPELMLKIQQDEPQRLRSAHPGLPRDLEAVAHKCLEKKPEARYASAKELAEDLRRWLDGEPVQARSVGWLDRQVKWTRRHPASSAAYSLTVLALLLLLVVGGFANLWQRARTAQKRAEKAEQEVIAANERAARAKQQEIDDKVQLLLQQARKSLSAAWKADDEVGLAEARSATERAVAMGYSGEASAGVQAQAAAMQQEVEEKLVQTRKNQDLRNALLDVFEPRSPASGLQSLIGTAPLPQLSVEEQYRKAFHRWGLDLDTESIDRAAAQLAQQPDRVVQEVIAGLDEWCLNRRLRGFPESKWQRLIDLANRLDANESRRELRDNRNSNGLVAERIVSVLAQEMNPWLKLADLAYGPNSRRLRQLVDNLNAAEEPVLGFLTLSITLEVAGEARRSEALLRAGRVAHPDSVVLLDAHAKRLLQQKPQRLDEALECYQVLRGLRPSTGLYLVDALAIAKRFPEAEAVARDLVRRNPTNAESHCYLGSALFLQGMLDQAARSFAEALQLQPDYGPAYLGLATVRANQMRMDEAVSAFRKAGEFYLQPDFALMAYAGLGAALEYQKKPEEAIVAYRKVVELKIDFELIAYPLSNLAELYALIGARLAELQQPKLAETAFQKALELQPDHAESYFWLGISLEGQQKYEQAETAYRKATQLKPDYARAYNNLGYCLDQQGKYAAAEAPLRKAIELEPDVALYYDNLGISLYRRKKFSAAEAALRQAVQLQPDFAWAYNRLGYCLNQQKKYREAEAMLRKAIALGLDDALPFDNLGISLSNQNRYSEAEVAYRHAIQLKPDFAWAYNRLGFSLNQQQKYIEGERVLRTAIQLLPEEAAPYTNLGDSLMGQQRYNEAEAAVRTAIRLNPAFGRAYSGLGNALRGLKQLKEALAAYRTADQLLPNDPVIAPKLRQTERWIEFDKRSAGILSGKEMISDAQDQLEFAVFCGHYLRAYRAAAKFFTRAFAAEPKLAGDGDHLYRYHAACWAALAAAGQGDDAAPLDEAERARLRQQALEWLRADLTSLENQLHQNGASNRSRIESTLGFRQQDPLLSTVRDAVTLAQLPAPEREEWRKLWADVERIRKGAQATKE